MLKLLSLTDKWQIWFVIIYIQLGFNILKMCITGCPSYNVIPSKGISELICFHLPQAQMPSGINLTNYSIWWYFKYQLLEGAWMNLSKDKKVARSFFFKVKSLDLQYVQRGTLHKIAKQLNNNYIRWWKCSFLLAIKLGENI